MADLAGWFARAIGWPETPEPQAEPEPPQTGAKAVTDADFHVRRFTLAVEQCAKGEARKAQLQEQLDYWLAVQAANALKPGA